MAAHLHIREQRRGVGAVLCDFGPQVPLCCSQTVHAALQILDSLPQPRET